MKSHSKVGTLTYLDTWETPLEYYLLSACYYWMKKALDICFIEQSQLFWLIEEYICDGKKKSLVYSMVISTYNKLLITCIMYLTKWTLARKAFLSDNKNFKQCYLYDLQFIRSRSTSSENENLLLNAV